MRIWLENINEQTMTAKSVDLQEVYVRGQTSKKMMMMYTIQQNKIKSMVSNRGNLPDSLQSAFFGMDGLNECNTLTN